MHTLRNPAFARRRRAAVVAAVCAAAALACSGSSDAIAQFDTVAYNSTLYALNGAPVGTPTAINTPVAATVRADIAYAFDVAFDLTSDGRPIVLSQRRVGLPLGSSGHEVGLQLLTGTFDAIAQAPSGGWALDTALTVNVGQVVGVRAVAVVCQLELSPYIYSKLIVDSVSVPAHRLWVHTITDPNCGFRDLTIGRPRN